MSCDLTLFEKPQAERVAVPVVPASVPTSLVYIFIGFPLTQDARYRDTSWKVSRFSLGSHHPGGDNNGILGGVFLPITQYMITTGGLDGLSIGIFSVELCSFSNKGV